MKEQLIRRVQTAFQNYWSDSPSHIVHAPGRVNIIGEHTDYNQGFVLPCALQYGTAVAARPRTDQVINVIALDYRGHQVQFNAQLPIASSHRAPWADYVKGVVHVLLSQGHTLQGVDLMIGGDIPQGAGLSSSASLQVALGWLFSAMNGLELTQTEIALYAQRAENEFVGCQCGVMDQLTSALGSAGHAVLIDCQSLEINLISIPKNVQLVIVNSNVQRELVESAYNERRQQCEMAARILKVDSLRTVSLAELSKAQELLDETIYRRARHVVSENERTLAAVEALRAHDLETLGSLMRASHESLRVDFEVTVPPVDELVHLMNEKIGKVGGARMTGGGFGGCVVALIPVELTETLCDYVQAEYEKRTGLSPSIYLGEVGSGVQLIL